MKKQIEEVQNYFLNKITACEFELLEITGDKYWADLKVKVDGEYIFKIAINPDLDFTYCSGFMGINIPFNRTKNLIEYIEKQQHLLKQQRIAELERELEKARL